VWRDWSRHSERLNMRTVLLAIAAVLFGGDIASARHDEPLGVAELGCIAGLSLPPGAPVVLAPLGPGVLGGEAITTNGSTFTSLVVQPGLYRVSWSWVGSGWPAPYNIVVPEINGDPQVWQGNPIWPAIPFIDGLILVTAANSALQMVAQPGGNGTGNTVTTGNCQLIIQQLQ
jgi:hypothetical protein